MEETPDGENIASIFPKSLSYLVLVSFCVDFVASNWVVCFPGETNITQIDFNIREERIGGSLGRGRYRPTINSVSCQTEWPIYSQAESSMYIVTTVYEALDIGKNIFRVRSHALYLTTTFRAFPILATSGKMLQRGIITK